MGIKSWRSAQSFRKYGRKLKVAHSGARIFHYGWVRPAEAMLRKIKFMERVHHPPEEAEKRYAGKRSLRDHLTDLGNLALYTGTHPQVMKSKIESAPPENSFQFILTLVEDYFRRRTFIQRVKDLSRNVWIGEHKNFHLVEEKFKSLKGEPLLKIKRFGI